MKKALFIIIPVLLALMLSGVSVFADSTLDAALNVDGGSLVFENDLYNPWEVVQLDGRTCARSGNSGLADSESTLTLSIYLHHGQKLCFDWNVDSEATQSPIAMWDYLAFSVDNTMIDFIHSTEENQPLGWTRIEWTAPESGDYEFEWKYEKDSSIDQGADCGYVDNVSIEGTVIEPPSPTPEPLPGEEYVVYSEDFSISPEDWWNDDFDGDGYYWQWSTAYGHTDPGAIYSLSYGDYTGPLTPDNQACTPAFTISSNAETAELRFWLYSIDDEYCYEHIEVQIVEIFENFYGYYDMNIIATIGSITLQNGEWTEFVIDMTDYIGMEDINVAFVHCESTDQYGIVLDDISITAINGNTTVLSGDVNFDGNITVADALITLRHSMQLIELTDQALIAADYNGDGIVTSIDALMIMRIAME